MGASFVASILFLNFNSKSIKYLKVDTEGHDHVILNAYLDICEKRPELLADRIKFECHYAVSNMEEIEKLLTRFKGYEIHKDISDYILVKKHKIPRVIHQTYSTKELPDSLKLTTELVKTLNPSFEYRFYDDQACINFIKDVSSKYSNKKIVGYGHLDTTDLVAGPSGELVVHPDFRRKGIATQIVNEMKKMINNQSSEDFQFFNKKFNDFFDLPNELSLL